MVLMMVSMTQKERCLDMNPIQTRPARAVNMQNGIALMTEVGGHDSALHYIMTSCLPAIPRLLQSAELMADDALAVNPTNYLSLKYEHLSVLQFCKCMRHQLSLFQQNKPHVTEVSFS